MSSVLSPNILLNFVKIWRPVFEKWIFEILKDFTLFLVRPLPATPGGKFSGAFQGPAKRCQTPLEPRRNLLPVFSYDFLKFSEKNRNSIDKVQRPISQNLELFCPLNFAGRQLFHPTSQRQKKNQGSLMVFGTFAPLKVTHYFRWIMEKNHKNTCEWPLRGLCMYVRWRSEYLPYAYYRGPLPLPYKNLGANYVRYRNFVLTLISRSADVCYRPNVVKM